MNRYEVRFQSDDKRVWEVTVKADGMCETDDLVIFWRKGWLGLFRYNAHFIAKAMFVSAIGKPENK